MSLFKRLSASITSQVDQFVGEIENHDALIQAAITEQRKKIAGARVQLTKVKNSEKSIAEKITVNKEKEQVWARRAVEIADTDESQALLCLQRRQIVAEQLKRLMAAQEEYRLATAKMTADINHCEEELRKMVHKHELMRARQSSADAVTITNQAAYSCVNQLEDSFERWETKIAQAELCVESYPAVDTLEQEYIEKENEQQLRAELAELLNKEKDHDGNS